jgi:ABC-type Fe3+-hydroxamate transport system substrate-binding protein
VTVDDLGWPVLFDRPPERIISLVPSLTEALATDVPERLVGATDWCTHPASLDVTRVRGTKNPNLAAIADLKPDLVLANQEENRELDVQRLRASGVPVWVTRIESVAEALRSLERLYRAVLHMDDPDWLRTARHLWSGPADEPRGRIAVPIWRDPWMLVGSGTYTGDLLRLAGWENAFADGDGRYPTVQLADIDTPEIDLVLLPDEPYVFSPNDGPEAFTRTKTELASGRVLTWYGPAMVEAADLLRGQ